MNDINYIADTTESISLYEILKNSIYNLNSIYDVNFNLNKIDNYIINRNNNILYETTNILEISCFIKDLYDGIRIARNKVNINKNNKEN